jgi:WD40 repeat protein
VKLWDVAAGTQVASLEAHKLPVMCVAFSPDGRLLAAGSNDQTITIWDVATRQARRTLIGHNSYVISAAFSPDSRRLASGSAWGSIRLWDASSGRQMQLLEGQALAVHAVAFSPDGGTLASGHREGCIKLWDPATGNLLRTLTAGFGTHNSPRSLAYSADGRRLACMTPGEISIWSVAGAEREHSMKVGGTQPHVASIVFGPDGKWVASGNGFGVVKLFDAAGGSLLSTLAEKAPGGIEAIAVSPDGKWLAAGGDDYKVRLWRLRE